MQKKTKIILFLAILAGLSVIFPIPIEVVPEIKLKVINAKDEKISNVTVVQTWQHYSFESESHEENVVSNKEGIAIFPERKICVSVLSYLLDPVIEKININPHASSGASAYFQVKEYEVDTVWYEPGDVIPDKIIIKRKFEF